MAKRLLVCLLSLCMLMSMFPSAVFADEPTEGEIHDYVGVATTEPTCTEEGVMTYTCQTCGDSYTEAIPALGHTPSEEKDDYDAKKDPTCTEEGHEEFIHCETCGKVIYLYTDEETGETTWREATVIEGKGDGNHDLYEEYRIEALGHKYETVPAYTPEFPCAEDGWEEYVQCTVCGAYESGHEKKVIPAEEHTPVPKDPNFVPPRCDAEGPLSVAAICDVCKIDLEQEIEIPVPDHDWKTVKAQAPTCTEEGWKEYQQCDVCGAINTKDGKVPVIKALGHDYSVPVGSTAGGCVTDPYLEGYKCSRCDALKPGSTIEAPGHNLVEVPQVDPTCTEPGVKHYYQCSKCGELFKEDNEDNRKNQEKGDITDLKAWKADQSSDGGYIAPNGHTFVTVLGTKATCEEDGVGAHQLCTECGFIQYNDEGAKVISAYHHSNEDGFWPENWEGHKGGDTDERKVTLAEGTTAWDDPKNDGITFIYDPEDPIGYKAPACGVEGHEPAKLCIFCYKLSDTVCGECEDAVLSPAREIEPLEHKWELVTPGILPTCKDAGVSDLYKCTLCGITTGGDAIQPRNHKNPDGTSAMKEVAAVLPKCEVGKEDGHLKYSYCTLCGYAVAPAQEIIDTRLHEEDQLIKEIKKGEEIEVEKLPETGLPESFIIPAYNHKYVEPVRPVSATCTENGIKEGATRCLVCGEVFNLKVDEAKGHDFENVDEVKATCLKGGNEAYVVCSVCGKAAAGTKDKVNKFAELTNVPADFDTKPLGHDPQPGVGKEPTCTEKGKTNGLYCARPGCGMTIEKQKDIPAVGHKFEKIPQVDPTCTEAGVKEYFKCTVCGKLFDSETKKYTSEPDITKETMLAWKSEGGNGYIPPKGHVAGDVMEPILPTCTKPGYSGGVHCVMCENTLSYDAIVEYLQRHEEGRFIEAGWIVVPKLDPATGHQLKEVAAVEGTCKGEGKPGNKAYVYCEVCGKAAAGTKATVDKYANLTKTPEDFIFTVEHDWLVVGQGEKRAPTCTEAGSTGNFRQCQRCLEYEEEIVKALGHIVEIVAAKAPTCVDEGNEAYVYCSRCNNAVSQADYEADVKKLDDSEKTPEDFVIPATGEHTWKHVDAKMATCMADGHTSGQECEVCKEAKYSAVPKNAKEWHEYLRNTPAELEKIEWNYDKYEGLGLAVKLCPECGKEIVDQMEWPRMIKGDANMNGEIEIIDAALTLQYWLGKIDGSQLNLKAADYDEDGKISLYDVACILNAWTNKTVEYFED